MATTLAKLEPRELILLDNARRLLAEARTIDEVKTVRDKAAALEYYYRQRGLGLEAQNAAAEIKIRAERCAGAMLRQMQPARQRECRGGDRKSKSQRVTLIPPKLADLGIARMQSHRWQAIASVPERPVPIMDLRRYIRVAFWDLSKQRYGQLFDAAARFDDVFSDLESDEF